MGSERHLAVGGRTFGRARHAVLWALVQATRDGWPATVREIQGITGTASPSTTHNHLISLERAGLAASHPRNQAGGWKPTEEGIAMMEGEGS